MIRAVVPRKAGTVALYVSLEREHVRGVARSVAAMIREAGFGIALCDDQNGVLALATPDANVEDAVLLVTIGGDGTLLRAAQIAAPHRIPLFGINTGRLGFLTAADARGSNGLSLVVDILRDGFVEEERSALQAQLHGASHFALNDIVVRRSGTAHMTPFGLFVDGKEAAHVPADGIAVATPTGSTAYFLSAGGPILAPDVAAFGIVALLPHTLFSRPLVVPDSSTVELVCDSESDSATLEADGRVVAELAPGERVVVTRYPHHVRFARHAPLNFFRLLEEKLRWNAPIKEPGGG
jgi:NAD+ kinase